MVDNRNEKQDARLIAAHLGWTYTKALRALRGQVYITRAGQVERGVNYRADWQ